MNLKVVSLIIAIVKVSEAFPYRRQAYYPQPTAIQHQLLNAYQAPSNLQFQLAASSPLIPNSINLDDLYGQQQWFFIIQPGNQMFRKQNYQDKLEQDSYVSPSLNNYYSNLYAPEESRDKDEVPVVAPVDQSVADQQSGKVLKHPVGNVSPVEQTQGTGQHNLKKYQPYVPRPAIAPPSHNVFIYESRYPQFGAGHRAPDNLNLQRYLEKAEDGDKPTTDKEGNGPNTDKESSTQDPDSQQIPDEELGPSIAQAKPQAVSVAGIGGVAVGAPVGTAIVGPGGMALSAPTAMAVAGTKTGRPVDKDKARIYLPKIPFRHY